MCRILLKLAIVLTWTTAICADETRRWDFQQDLPASWTVIQGAWEAGDGTLRQTVGNQDRYMILCDEEMVEGTLEVEFEALRERAFLGLVVKWVDADQHVYLRHGGYDYLSLGGKGDLRHGPFGDFAIGIPRNNIGDRVRLKIVVRDGKIIYSVNGIVLAVMHDPLAGKAGRPGLYTEFPAIFRNFRVTRSDRNPTREHNK